MNERSKGMKWVLLAISFRTGPCSRSFERKDVDADGDEESGIIGCKRATMAIVA
jgi:hypothetical protein